MTLKLNYTPQCDCRFEEGYFLGPCKGPLYAYRSNNPFFRCERHAAIVGVWVALKNRNHSLSISAWAATLTEQERSDFIAKAEQLKPDASNWQPVEVVSA